MQGVIIDRVINASDVQYLEYFTKTLIIQRL